MSGRPSAPSGPDRKIRETVSLARPGSSSSSSRGAAAGGDAALSYTVLSNDLGNRSLGSIAGSAARVPSPAKKSVSKADDDYDDDFEPYENEEFETEEDPPTAPKASAGKTAVSAPATIAPSAAIGPRPSSRMGPSSSIVMQEASQAAALRKGQADEMQAVLRSVQQENSAVMSEAKRRPRESSEASKDGDGGSEERPRFGASQGRGRGPQHAAAPGNGSSSPSAGDAKTDAGFRDAALKTSRRPRKFSGMDMLSENVSAGPREGRLRSLRDLLDMRTDSFVHLTLAPRTKYETFQRMLRADPPTIAQQTTSTRSEQRDIDTGTDPIEQVHREIQVGLGDEIDLLNIIRCIKDRRSSGKTQFKQSLLEEAGVAPMIPTMKADRALGSGSRSEFEAESGGPSGLSSFLQRSSRVMESLLVEGELRAAQRSGRKNPGSSSNSLSSYRLPDSSPDTARVDSNVNLFTDSYPWATLGRNALSGYLEYIKNRPPSIVRFSGLQPNVMITCHAAPENEEMAQEEMKPNSALYCIWDVLSSEHPTRILSGPGVPTAVAFSVTQSFLVVAGTMEGSVHMWDLREANSMHLDRDAIDLKVLTGVRKACFSCYERIAETIKNSSSTSSLVLFESQHTGAIVQVESLDPTGGQGSIVVSQFVTIDDSGLLVIWLSSANIAFNGIADLSSVKSIDIKEDIGLSPQSSIKLVKLRVIRPDCRMFYQPAPGNPSEPLFASSTGVLPVFAVSPWDPSVLYVAVGKGAVYRGSCGGSSNSQTASSAGVASTASYFKRQSSSRVVVNVNAGSDTDRKLGIIDTEAAAAVSCIAVSPKIQGVFASDKHMVSFVLVGRVDGCIDLFVSNSDAVILSWQLNSEAEIIEKSKSNGFSKARSVVCLKWLPGSNSCFIAADNQGVVYSFDLCKSTDHAVEVDISAIDASKGTTYKALHRARIDVSGNHSMGAFSACFVGMCRYKKESSASGAGALISDGVLRVRRVDPLLVAKVDESLGVSPKKAMGESKYSDEKSALSSNGIHELLSEVLPGRMGRDASSSQVRVVLEVEPRISTRK